VENLSWQTPLAASGIRGRLDPVVLDTDYATDDEALIAGVDPNRPAETVGGEFSTADLLVHAACPLRFGGNRDQLLAPEMEILGCVCVFDDRSYRSDTQG